MAVDFKTFQELKIQTGKIIEVADFKEAKVPAYKLKIDFGELGVKKSSAQLPKWYKKEELMNRTVVCATGFPPKQIANFLSECLVLGALKQDGEVVLLKPDKEVGLGLEIA